MTQAHEEFLRRWQTRRDDYARVSATVDGAKVLDEVIADLTRVLASESDTVLTLEAASRRSGYSKDHLSRLIREGVIANAGRRGAPRIRLGDLPQRAPTLGSRRESGYNPIADARALHG